MKIIIISFKLAFFLVVAACSATVENIRKDNSARINQGSTELTVLTYNIRIGAGLQDFGRNPYKLKDEVVLDLEPVIKAIRSLDPDVVALQEVLGRKQAKEIGERLGFNYSYVPHGVDRYGVWWGVATLSKHPIKKVKRHEISSGRGNTRANLISTIDVNGRDIVVTNIHKDRDIKNGKPLRRTLAKVKKSNKPSILIGDLNIKPTYKRYAILKGEMMDTAVAINSDKAKFIRKRGTYIGKDGQSWNKRIDYIFVDNENFKVLDIGLLDEKHWPASDHLGYFAKLRLLGS